MNLLSAPLTLRANSDLSHVDVSIEFLPGTVRLGAEVFVARETHDVEHWGGDTVIVIDQTKAGPSADQIIADLSGVDALAVPTGWFAVVDLIAVVYPGDEFTLTWIDSGGDEISAVPEQAQMIQASLEEHKGNAQAIMGCDVPAEKVSVYVADFGPTMSGAAAFVKSGIIYVPKRTLSKSPDKVQSILAHEYFHVIQAHMVGRSTSAKVARITAGDEGIGPWWWREASAEFAATRLLSKYVKYFLIDTWVAVEGLADLKDSKHRYRLNIYFRYLFETRGMKVCDFMRAQKALLTNDAPIEALSAQLGVEPFVQSYLEFAEALFFFPTSDNFGESLPAISSSSPGGLEFATGSISYPTVEFRGAYGIEVTRTIAEPQTLLIGLDGPLVSSEGSSPQLQITDMAGNSLAATGDLIAAADGGSTSVALPQMSANKFFVTVSQGKMSAHSSIHELNLSLSEMAMEAALSGTETSEDGSTVTIDVSLSADPGNRTVVVDATSSNTAEGQVDKNQIVFDQANPWNIPQQITVTGQSDGVEDGDVPYSIELRISAPADWQPPAADPYMEIELENLNAIMVDSAHFSLAFSYQSPGVEALYDPYAGTFFSDFDVAYVTVEYTMHSNGFTNSGYTAVATFVPAEKTVTHIITRSGLNFIYYATGGQSGMITETGSRAEESDTTWTTTSRTEEELMATRTIELRAPSGVNYPAYQLDIDIDGQGTLSSTEWGWDQSASPNHQTAFTHTLGTGIFSQSVTQTSYETAPDKNNEISEGTLVSGTSHAYLRLPPLGIGVNSSSHTQIYTIRSNGSVIQTSP